MVRVAWKLTDNSTGEPEEWLFPINPKEYAPANRRANITEESTTAPNGQVLLFQGVDQAGRGSIRGAAIGAAMYTDLKAWTEKFYPLQLTDDLGNAIFILITDVRWTRLHRSIERHRYDYDIEFIVLGA